MKNTYTIQDENEIPIKPVKIFIVHILVFKYCMFIQIVSYTYIWWDQSVYESSTHLICNILISVEYSLNWYYNLVSLSECSLLTYPLVWFKWVFLIKHNRSFIYFTISLNIRIHIQKFIGNRFHSLEN